MDEEALGKALVGAASRLASQIARDPALRDGLRALAQIVLDATSEPPPPPAANEPSANGHAPTEPPALADAVAPDEPQAPRPAPPPAGPLPPLTLGQVKPWASGAELPPGNFAGAHARGGVDLITVAARCRLKVEATRLAADHAPLDSERPARVNALIARARELPDCYLWMLQPHASLVAGRPALAASMTLGYEVLAEAAEMLERWDALHRDDVPLARAVLQLAAEAQSALRVCVEDLGGRKDSDQVAIYDYIRSAGMRLGLFIARHMKLADPGRPEDLPDLRRRIAEQAGKLDSARAGDKARTKRAKTIAYHAGLIREGRSPDLNHDWKKIAEAADLAVREGIPPSSPEIREALLPIFDAMPEMDDLPAGFDLVYREVDRFLAATAEAEPEKAAREPTPEVHAVADRLRGRKVVFIGGVPRPHNREALRAAFELEELIWLETREHQSIESFEHDIARPDVDLVILAIRWSSHSFEGAKDFCDRHGKPMLRLKAGYSPNTVAVQILAQCSEQLGIGPLAPQPHEA